MNRKGFSSVAIILVIVIVLVIGGGIWYYKMHQPATPDQNNSAIMDPSWVGQYTFSEYASPNETWVYDLAILNGSSSPSATLDINGFQTQISLAASVQEPSSGTLEIVFNNDEGSQPPLSYSAGDLLFSLTETTNGAAITWGKLQPMLTQDINGAVFVPPTTTDIGTPQSH